MDGRLSIQSVLAERRQAILRIAAAHGVTSVQVFGSALRAEGTPNDLDLLIDLEPGRSLLDEVAFWQEVEELLGCEVDVVTQRGVSPYLRDRILAEARPL